MKAITKLEEIRDLLRDSIGTELRTDLAKLVDRLKRTIPGTAIGTRIGVQLEGVGPMLARRVPGQTLPRVDVRRVSGRVVVVLCEVQATDDEDA